MNSDCRCIYNTWVISNWSESDNLWHLGNSTTSTAILTYSYLIQQAPKLPSPWIQQSNLVPYSDWYSKLLLYHISTDTASYYMTILLLIQQAIMFYTPIDTTLLRYYNSMIQQTITLPFLLIQLTNLLLFSDWYNNMLLYYYWYNNLTLLYFNWYNKLLCPYNPTDAQSIIMLLFSHWYSKLPCYYTTTDNLTLLFLNWYSKLLC